MQFVKLVVGIFAFALVRVFVAKGSVAAHPDKCTKIRPRPRQNPPCTVRGGIVARTTDLRRPSQLRRRALRGPTPRFRSLVSCARIHPQHGDRRQPWRGVVVLVHVVVAVPARQRVLLLLPKESRLWIRGSWWLWQLWASTRVDKVHECKIAAAFFVIALSFFYVVHASSHYLCYNIRLGS